MLYKEDFIGVGTSRAVFDNSDGTVTKIPLSKLGIDANIAEYQNANENSNVVASCISLEENKLVQEKLYDIKEYTWSSVKDGSVKELIRNDYPEDKEQVELIIENIKNKKLCVGRDSNGILKQFDFEWVKLGNEEKYHNDRLYSDEFDIDKFMEYLDYLGTNDLDIDFITFVDWLRR